jgi:hypothetical protein
MFVHSVYFWLHDGLSQDEHARFSAGVRSLCAIEDVQQGFVGIPASTDRPIIERGYSRSLVLAFADQAAHDRYQVHPVHDRFRADCSELWHKVLIYDSVSPEDA